MSTIIACVPNISEGRDQGFLDDLSQRLSTIPNLIMLDVAIDQAQNRTVVSFTGTREAIFEGGFLIYEMTLKHVDMREHHGDYPRVGAVDVFPFVPLKNATIEEAKAWSLDFATQVSERFKLPVYLFGESARYRYRRDVQNIRQGEYEGFAEKMKDLRWKPDLGPDTFPADSGVTMIGARHPLLSFKVFLGSRDEAIAHHVAHCVADASGGHIRAYPAKDHDRDLASLSVAITNFQLAPLYRVVENIRLEARRFGVEIRKIQLTGLIPEIVLIEAAEYYLGVSGFDHADLLERNIQQHLNEQFLFGE